MNTKPSPYIIHVLILLISAQLFEKEKWCKDQLDILYNEHLKPIILSYICKIEYQLN